MATYPVVVELARYSTVLVSKCKHLQEIGISLRKIKKISFSIYFVIYIKHTVIRFSALTAQEWTGFCTWMNLV